MNVRDELMLELLMDLLMGGGPPIDPNGKHKHQCQCGVVWEHPNSRANDEDAHCCPDCGEMLDGGWWHYEGPDAPAYVEGPDGYPMAA